MIIAQHAANKNILAKQSTNIEESTKYLRKWDGGIAYVTNDIVAYSGKLYKSLQDSNQNKQPDIEYAWWEELKTGDGGAGILDVTQLEGYGIKATATTDATLALASALIPFRDTTTDLWVDIGSRNWILSNPSPGIISWGSGNGESVVDGVVKFRRAGGTWGTNKTTDYAQVPTGFYWICFPGSGGTSIKVWYDLDKVYDAIQGQTADVYIDQAGCLWLGDPTSGGMFVCGSTMEDGFGENIANTYYDDEQNLTAMCPMANDGNKCRIDTSGGSTWQNTSGGVGSGKTFSGGQDYGLINNGTIFFFNLADTGTWTSFADVPTGIYMTTVPYKDGSTNNIEGTKLLFWYDKDKYIQAFRGNNADAYIDQLGNIWKDNPASGGEFVCGPYEGTAYAEYMAHKHDADYLNKTNTTAFTPSADYHPSTKKYVDDNAGGQSVPIWNSGATYNNNDLVNFNGRIYQSIQASNTNHSPSEIASAWWDRVINHALIYDAAGIYNTGDICWSAGLIYKSLSDSQSNHTPASSPSYWTSISAAELNEINNVNAGSPTDGQVLTYDTATSKWIAATPSGGGGAEGASGTITAGNTEVTIVVTGAVYNRAVVSNVGTNGGQRQSYIKSITDDTTDTTVVVAIDSSYTEDIDVHIVLANE